MGTQGYRATYLAAFDTANNQLDAIYEEYHHLQLRKESLEEALTALEPFVHSAHSREIHDPEPVRIQAHSLPHLVEEPVTESYVSAEPITKAVHSPEPIAPAAYAPAAEGNLDPIQRRINSALGLAVA